MATTGAKLPGTGTSVARSTGTAWTNPGNITVNDNTVASCNSGAAGSAFLRASNFAFGIPANSLIRGFTVVVEMAESSAGTETVSVQIVGAAGTAIGTAKTFVASGTALTVYTTGSGTDVWGTTGLTATDLNDTDFGIYVWYTTSHNTTVDFVSINVTYEPPISGSLAATETGTDTASINGKVNVRGNLAATETGTDTTAFSGTVSNSAITGSFAAIETGADNASILGGVLVQGSLNATETGSDTSSINGKVLVQGSLNSVETGEDLSFVSGKVFINGSLNTTEIGQDVANISGFTEQSISGFLSATETGQDSASFSASEQRISGGRTSKTKPKKPVFFLQTGLSPFVTEQKLDSVAKISPVFVISSCANINANGTVIVNSIANLNFVSATSYSGEVRGESFGNITDEEIMILLTT